MNNKLTAQSDNTIPWIFPVYSSNEKGPNFGLHCKNQLLRYQLWHTTQDNVWGDQLQSATNEIYISKWKDFLQTSFAKEHVPEWYEKLHTVQNYSESETDVQHSTPQELSQREEWMLLADLFPRSFVNSDGSQQTPYSNYDWQMMAYMAARSTHC